MHTDFSGGRSGGLVFQSLKIFQLVVHTVKGFGIVNKAKVDVFLGLCCFFDDPMDVGNLISGSSAFSKSSLIFRTMQVFIKIMSTQENYYLLQSKGQQ